MKLKHLLLLLPIFAIAAQAAVETRDIEYRDGDTVLRGFAAFDPALKPRNGVLIVHQWMGLTDYEKGRARQLAELGFYAFALDIYGIDNRPADRAQAGAAAGRFKGDRGLYRRRLALGLQQLTTLSNLSPEQIAAIGYCFGGTGVLELARSGAPVAGVVSFHGGLDSPTPADGANIRTKVLVCHGADDPFVKPADIDAFRKELVDANVDWQMIYYSGAVHSFTQKMAGNDNSAGAAYNERADLRSWGAMRQFLAELFPPR